MTGSPGSAIRASFATDGSINFTGDPIASSSFRAPIFYDLNNTGFYIDPSSSSVFNNSITTTSINGGLRVTSSGTATTQAAIAIQQVTGEGDTIIFADYEPYAEYGIIARNVIDSIDFTSGTTANSIDNYTITNRSGSARTAYVKTRINLASGITTMGDARAPIFYDSNDTGYFGNFASISSLWGLAIRGDNGPTSTDNQIFFWGGGNTTTSAIGFKNNGGSFPNPTSNGDGYNTYLTMDTPGRGWVFREGVGGTNFGAVYTSGWILNNGLWQANAQMRAPIFFDSNNTNYYLDPSSTTSLRTVGSWRADSAAWDGEFNGKIQYHANHWYIQAADLLIYRNSGGTNVFTVNQSGQVTAISNYLSQLTTASGRSNLGFQTTASTLGNIHIQNGAGPGANNSNQGAITFQGDTASQAQAGIYVLNNNSYGTSMGFATTDSYAIGPQLFMTAANNGQVNFPRSFVSANDIRATIFYDLNNTAFYFDGASGTNLNYLNVNGTWGSNPFSNGLAQFTVQGSYASMYQTSTIDSLGYALHHIASNGSYYLYTGRGVVNGTDWNWNFRAYPNQDGNIVEFRTDVRSPIYYDSNDTGFFINPNSNSNLAALQVATGIATNSFVASGNGGQITITASIGSFGGYLRTSGHMVLDQTNTGFGVYVLDGNSVGVVKGAGAQSWSAFSDRTLKTIHYVMENNLSKLESISPIYYSFNNFADDKNRIGLIAQEVQEHFPELVEVEPMSEKLVLDYTGLIPVLLGAIKELKNKVENLEKQL
jgi:hypothetical protein